MEAIAHLLLSIVATAVLAGIIVIFRHEDPYLLVWFLCFCGWWGIFFIGSEC
jgi:hypothetical protein